MRIDIFLLFCNLLLLPIVLLFMDQKLKFPGLLDGHRRFFKPLLVCFHVQISIFGLVKLHAFFDKVFVWHYVLIAENFLQDLLVKFCKFLLFTVSNALYSRLFDVIVCLLHIFDNFVLLLQINVQEVHHVQSLLRWLVLWNLIIKYFEAFQGFDEILSLFLFGHS